MAADSPQSFLDDTPTSKLIRQILGAVSEFDKAMVVAKLKGARDRKRAITGEKVEGRKSHAEVRPELVALVRQLRRMATQGWPTVAARHLSRACAARHRERARVSPSRPRLSTRLTAIMKPCSKLVTHGLVCFGSLGI